MQHRYRKRLLAGWNRMLNGKRRKAHCCSILSDVPAETEVTITCNHNYMTIERGLYTGVRIRVLRNEPSEPNLVIAVEDARYVLDRRIADSIRIREEKD
jgi:Fe2+ transport system protein FeoA